MQVKRNSKSRRITLKTVLIFTGILIIAYFPLSSFMFSLKNDSFTGYFPSRFFISESLKNNSFPLWNPYINFGLPQYGDMNSGFWNPLTWIIAILSEYNAYSFTVELLFYVLLSGIGMFQLCRSYKFTKTVAYISGFSYMCSGFMVAHLQHFNWISAAAFLPWCIWAYNLLINKFSMKNSIICSILFYFFLSASHPGMIIGFIYFFLSYVTFFYLHKKKEEPNSFNSKSFFKKNGWMIGLMLVLSFGMITGYTDIIPNMTRGAKIDNLSNIINPFTIQSLISLIFPMATVKAESFYNTDISMRNMYFGLTLFLFFIVALKEKRNSYQSFFLYIGLFFFILSLGGIFKYFTCKFLPFIGYVRLSGEFLIFSLFSFVIFAAFSLNNFIVEKKSYNENLSKTFHYVQLIIYSIIITGFCCAVFFQNSFIFHISDILKTPGTSAKLKSLVDNFSIFDAMMLQGILQTGFWNAIKKNIKEKTYKVLINLVAIEMIIATLLNIPFTGVGQDSTSDVETIIKRAPEGMQAPYYIPIYRIYSTKADRYKKLVGDWSFFSKQIGVDTKSNYPVELNNTKIVFKDSLSLFCYKPFIFNVDDSNETKIKVNSFKGNNIVLTVYSNKPDTLVYQQNIYPHWNCVVNGEFKKPIPYKKVFNAVELKPGKNYVQFSFVPKAVVNALSFSKYAFLLCIIYLGIIFIKRPSL